MSEKQYKPVPDVECLKYHGTPDKPDIKIFVSHRIDLDSETIDNPLYIPVRCGAVYDEREGVTMLGDDTGDNISEKRDKYGELTVLYWAWKNIEADYYGLCRDDKYMVFSDKNFKCDKKNWSQVVREHLTVKPKEEFGLLDAENTMCQITVCDGVLPKAVDIGLYDTPSGKKDSVGEFWKAFEETFIFENCIEMLIRCVRSVKPQYAQKFEDYLSNRKSFNLNCFVLKKIYFFKLCEFIFPVLDEIDRKLDSSHYSKQKLQAFNRIGEILIGSFLYHTSKECKTNDVQIVHFSDVQKVETSLQPAFNSNNIPIVLMSSSYFAPYISALLQSIVDTSTKSYKYDIIILHKNIDEQTQEKLKKITLPKGNISVRFFRASKIFADTKLYVSNPEYAEEAYYRVLTPWILPCYDKAIVMDGDTIVKSDIAELYEIDLGDNLAGAVEDIVFQGMLNLNFNKDLEYSKEVMELDDPYCYVNTGVVLMNLKAQRLEFSQEKIVEFLGSHKYRIQEQDAMNVLYKRRIKLLDLHWNYYVETNTWVTQMIEAAPIEKYRYYRAQKGIYGIVHYANRPRPWDEPSMVFAEDFWNSARKTEFYELLLSRMAASQAYVIHMNNLQLPDPRSGARKFADKLLPKGTRRREFAKLLLPKGSLRWRFCKQIYYIFKPQYRPKKEVDIEDTVEEDED